MDRLEDLFHRALGLPTEQRASFAREACGDDRDLRRALLLLLAADSDVDGRLALEQTEAASAEEMPLSSTLPQDPGQTHGRPESIGRYRIVRTLGRGGMGRVYLGYDDTLQRRVAIKTLLSADPALHRRFLVEARATARCTHENIVAIHEIGEHHGSPFLALEYIDGVTLRQHLANCGPLVAHHALTIARDLANALQHAHELGIVHRDLKPENILITREGVVKVVDFGIAKLRRDDALVRAFRALPRDQIGITWDGAIMGTLPYMSPEQWRGEEVTARSDIWAFGIILFEMLAGEHPLAPLSVDRLQQVADLDRAAPRLFDRMHRYMTVSALIQHCLEKRVEQRLTTEQLAENRLWQPLLASVERKRARDDEDGVFQTPGTRFDHTWEEHQDAGVYVPDGGLLGERSRLQQLPGPPHLVRRVSFKWQLRQPPGDGHFSWTGSASEDLENLSGLMIYSPAERPGREDSNAAYTIGRAPTSDIALSADRTVSRQHALLQERDGNWYLEDRDSRHGTWTFDGSRPPGQASRLHSGSSLQLGKSWFSFITAGDLARVVDAELDRQSAAAERWTMDAPGRLSQVPELPSSHLYRVREANRVVDALCSTAPSPRVHAIHGDPGVGKSVLAAAVARDERVRRRFSDGVHWLTLSPASRPGRLYQQLCRATGLESSPGAPVQEIENRLREHLVSSKTLLVLDGAGDRAQLRWLDVVGRLGRVLLTTSRPADTGESDIAWHPLSSLTDAQARYLLARCAGIDQDDTHYHVSQELAQACARLPAALAAIGQLVRAGHLTLSDASESLHRLPTETTTDATTDATTGAHVSAALPPALALTIEIGLQALPTEAGLHRDVALASYADLALFPSGEPVPRQAYLVLWAARALTVEQVDALANALVRLQLAHRHADDSGDALRLAPHHHVYLQTRGNQEEATSTPHDLARFVDSFLQASNADDLIACQSTLVAAFTTLASEHLHLERADMHYRHLALFGPEVPIARDVLCALWSSPPLSDHRGDALTRLLVRCGLATEGGSGDQPCIALAEHHVAYLRKHIQGTPFPLHRAYLEAFAAHVRAVSGYDHALACHRDLSLLPENEPIAHAVLEVLWARRSPSTEHIDALVEALQRYGLAGEPTGGMGGSLVLERHHHQYLQALGSEDLGTRHHALVEAFGRLCDQGLEHGPIVDGPRAYFYAQLPRHLMLADRRYDMRSLTLSYPWLAGKLGDLGFDALMSDFELLARHGPLEIPLALLRDTLSRSTRALTQHPRQLPGQLQGRMAGIVAGRPELTPLQQLLDRARERASHPWLEPVTPVLDPVNGTRAPSAAKHDKQVHAVCLDAGGTRALSGSSDGTVKYWDARSGALLATFGARKRSVRAVALSADGRRAFSGGLDNVIRIWNPAQGKLLATLEGHDMGVVVLVLSTDGTRLISGDVGGTSKVWDVTHDQLLRSDNHQDLQGQSWNQSSISCLETVWRDAAQPQLRAVSANGAHALEVLDASTAALRDATSDALLATFTADAEVTAWAVSSGPPTVVCLGQRWGHVHFLHLVDGRSDHEAEAEDMIDSSPGCPPT